jgi:hypothetical protein
MVTEIYWRWADGLHIFSEIGRILCSWLHKPFVLGYTYPVVMDRIAPHVDVISSLCVVFTTQQFWYLQNANPHR